MNFTDMSFIAVLGVLMVAGYFRGFLRTIIGPCSLCIATVGAYYLFKHTHNPISALTLGLFGPMFLGLIINLILDNTVLRGKPPQVSTISQIAGALFNLAWGALVCLSILAGLVVIPLDTFGLGDINQNVRTSMTYHLLKDRLATFGVIPPDDIKACTTGTCSMVKPGQEQLMNDKDVQEVLNDPRILKLVSDPAMQAAIEKQDVAAMISNPVIFELGQDPAFIAKAMRIYPKIKAAGALPKSTPSAH